ncbi:MAG: hypothetical protein ACYS4W_03300 [Planctomycetota bacterium]|jgi:hypothetical protein
MNETRLLLNAYYESLHERLEAEKGRLAERMEKLLREEIAKRRFGSFDEDKLAAYMETCLAFVDERIEMYNPIGIQYTFEAGRRRQAFELELQLDWYNSRAEFEALVEAARARAEAEITQATTAEQAEELIEQMGAFPDKSIISAYEAQPALGKLPDYVVARAIEEMIR